MRFAFEDYISLVFCIHNVSTNHLFEIFLSFNLYVVEIFEIEKKGCFRTIWSVYFLYFRLLITFGKSSLLAFLTYSIMSVTAVCYTSVIECKNSLNAISDRHPMPISPTEGKAGTNGPSYLAAFVSVLLCLICYRFGNEKLYF